MDPVDFLSGYAPFCDLGQGGREKLAALIEITFARSGDRLLERGKSNPWLFVVRKGSVRLALDGQQVDELGPGEIFGLSAMTGDAVRFDAVALADCLLYRLNGEGLRELYGREPAFAAFFLKELSERLRALADGGQVAFGNELATAVGELIARPPIFIPLTATAGDAARLMDRERISSVLVQAKASEASAERPIGIVTDHDLRRVLARGQGPETPLGDVFSAPLMSVAAELSGAEAMLLLLRRGVHHLPVERDGRVIGVLTHSDLLRQRQSSPGTLYKKISKAPNAQALSSYAGDIAAMIDTLHRGRVEATDIGRLVAALGDALASRLLRLAEADLGPPPCAYAWIVFGSEGRQEQSLLTDQDNALIYAEDTGEAEAYFEKFAERVVGDLIEVGFPPCEGGFMATHWRRPLARWCEQFRGYIEQPEPEALLEAANFFDLRVIYGGLDLEPLEEIVRAGSTRRLFLAQLARAALDLRPPLGMLHRIRESPAGVDLKAGALMPIVGLARVFALEAGERHGSTLQRLAKAGRAGKISAEGAEQLGQAFRFAFSLRLRHHLEDRRAGRAISNHVHLEELSPGERRHLKETFLLIDTMQRATADRLDLHRLG